MTPPRPPAFDSRWQSAALKRIADALWRQDPLVVITGPSGVGKTTVCERIARRDHTRTFVALLPEPPVDGEDFLRGVLAAFGVLSSSDAPSAPHDLDQLRMALRRFFDGLAALRARALIIVDDAHDLPTEALDEVRAVVRLQRERRLPVQAVLIGLSEIDDVEHDGFSRPTLEREGFSRASPDHDVLGPELDHLSFEGERPPLPVDEPLPAARLTLSRPWRLAWRPRVMPPRSAAAAIAATIVIVGAIGWRGIAPRLATSAAAPARATASKPLVASRTTTDQTALLGTVAARSSANGDKPRPERSTGVLSESAAWRNTIVRRAEVLARQPNVNALLELRSVVEARRDAAADPNEIEALLRQVDGRLDEARRRQLEIDHRLLTTTR